MIETIKSSRPTQVLIAANIALALFVAGVTLYPARASVPEAQDGEALKATLPDFGNTSLAAPPMAQLVDMIERPLFYVDRTLPEPPAEVAVAPSPLRLKLEGVAMAGGSRVAVLRNLQNNSLMQLREGMIHEGWKLDAVDSGSAKFSRGDEVTELPLAPGNSSRRL